MTVITIFNEKGGVGKTTLTSLLGTGLALRGKRVLLLDSDGQGDLTRHMSFPPESSFYDWVMRPRMATVELIDPVPQDVCPAELFIVRGNNETWGIPSSANMTTIVSNMAARLEEVQDVFDYVLIDTQPSATTLHDAIALVSDWLLIPTDAEPFSTYGGLRSTLRHIDNVRNQARVIGVERANVLGIVPNKFRSKTSLHQHILEQLRHEYGSLLWDPIPLRTSIPEAQYLQETMMTAAPHLEINEDVWNFVDRVIAEATDVEA